MESDPEVEIDYTEVDSIKFSKQFKGLERAKHIAQVFADYFGVSLYDGHRASSYKEFGVKTDSFFMGFRGYTNIVVCIVNDYGFPNFGPNGRSRALTRGELFQETKNLFPFREVLNIARQKVNKVLENKRNVELAEQEENFRYLSLEGQFLSNIENLDLTNITRTRYGATIGLEFSFSKYDRYYQTKVYQDINDDNKFLIRPFGTGMQIENCSIEKVCNFIQSVKDLYKEE